MNPQPYAPKAYALARLRYYSLVKPRTFGHYKEAFGVCYESINTIAFIMSKHFYAFYRFFSYLLEKILLYRIHVALYCVC